MKECVLYATCCRHDGFAKDLHGHLVLGGLFHGSCLVLDDKRDLPNTDAEGKDERERVRERESEGTQCR